MGTKRTKSTPKVTPLAKRSEAALPVPVTGPALIERLATDPNVDVEKLERLIAMHERIAANTARSAFEAALAEMQPKIPEIDRKGRIAIPGRPAQAYPRNEDIQKAIRPVLAAHGFALTFRTEWPQAGIIRVVGILSHAQGHARESVFEGPADDSGSKNQIQALGSTVSYGRRYTTCDLLNITSRGQDTDGAPPPERGHSHTQTPFEPDTRVITDAQRKRLWVLIKKSGRPETEVKMWLAARFDLNSSKAIQRKDYETICDAVQSPDPLLLPQEPDVLERDPGEDG